MTKKVYILGGLRSHIGIQNGVFKKVLPEVLGAEVLKKLVEKYNIKDISEIVCGNTVSMGGNISRLMTLYAGIKSTVPAYTIDMQCASGSVAIDIAYSNIRSGKSELVIAGGIESTSTEVQKSLNINDPRYYYGNNEFSVAQFSPDEFDDKVMLRAGERVAEKYNITKKELDFWSLESHRRAKNAKENGILKDVIIPIFNSYKDEGIRENINERFLNRLKPLVKDNGKINIGNTSLKNDGAAFLILCSDEYIKKNRIVPKAEILDTASIGVDPKYSPEAAGVAVNKILLSNSMTYDDISLYEYNEAFGVIDVMFKRENPELIDRYNILGGALAYGHPYGHLAQ